MSFHDTYLRAVWGFIGFSSIDLIDTDEMTLGEQAMVSALSYSRCTMTELIPA